MSTDTDLGKINAANIYLIKAVYVAGPFLGKTPWHTHLNTNKAELECAKIWEGCAEDVFVLSPHQNTRNMTGVVDERAFVVGYLKAIDICDAALFLPGWENSKGTKGEILRAFEKAKAIFFDTDQLIDWVLGDLSLDDAYNCGLCGTYVKQGNLSHNRRCPLCDACASKAWPEARYQPGIIGEWFKKKGFIDE